MHMCQHTKTAPNIEYSLQTFFPQLTHRIAQNESTRSPTHQQRLHNRFADLRTDDNSQHSCDEYPPRPLFIPPVPNPTHTSFTKITTHLTTCIHSHNFNTEATPKQDFIVLRTQNQTITSTQTYKPTDSTNLQFSTNTHGNHLKKLSISICTSSPCALLLSFKTLLPKQHNTCFILQCIILRSFL